MHVNSSSLLSKKFSHNGKYISLHIETTWFIYGLLDRLEHQKIRGPNLVPPEGSSAKLLN